MVYNRFISRFIEKFVNIYQFCELCTERDSTEVGMDILRRSGRIFWPFRTFRTQHRFNSDSRSSSITQSRFNTFVLRTLGKDPKTATWVRSNTAQVIYIDTAIDLRDPAGHSWCFSQHQYKFDTAINLRDPAGHSWCFSQHQYKFDTAIDLLDPAGHSWCFSQHQYNFISYICEKTSLIHT